MLGARSIGAGVTITVSGSTDIASAASGCQLAPFIILPEPPTAVIGVRCLRRLGEDSASSYRRAAEHIVIKRAVLGQEAVAGFFALFFSWNEKILLTRALVPNKKVSNFAFFRRLMASAGENLYRVWIRCGALSERKMQTDCGPTAIKQIKLHLITYEI